MVALAESRIVSNKKWQMEKMNYKLALTSVHRSVLADFYTSITLYLSTCVHHQVGATWLTTNSNACKASPGTQLTSTASPYNLTHH